MTQTPGRMRLLWLTLAAAIIGSAIIFCAVLPAEYGFDPTGVGRIAGLTKIAAAQPPETVIAAAPTGGGAVARSAVGPFRSDTVDIPLGPDGELEYKVRMKEGASLVYSWEVEGYESPDLFYYDFHSESWPTPEGRKSKVTEYEQKLGIKESGALTAPFAGVHGWYLQNQGEKPVTVHLKVAGFYDLIPPGEYGNLEGIAARK